MLCPVCGYESLNSNEKTCPYCGYTFPIENEMSVDSLVIDMVESVVDQNPQQEETRVCDFKPELINPDSADRIVENKSEMNNCEVIDDILQSSVNETTSEKRSLKRMVVKVLASVAVLGLLIVMVWVIKDKLIERRGEKKAEINEMHVSETSNEDNVENDSSIAVTPEVTVEFLVGILNSRTTISDLKREGYELTYLGSLNYKTKTIKLYSFKNCDVVLAVSGYDQNKLYNYDHYIEEVPAELEEIVNEADLVVVGVQGPASILLPDKIGEIGNRFIKEDVLYCANCNFYSYGFALSIDWASYIEIDYNTSVCIYTKSSVGEANYNDLCEILEVFENSRPDDEDYSDDSDDYPIEEDENSYVVLIPYDGEWCEVYVYRIDGYETAEFWEIFYTGIFDYKLTEQDIMTFTPKELTYLRNRVYALNDYKFNSKELYDYFSQYLWYWPNENFTDDVLSDIENITLTLFVSIKRKMD